MTDGRTKPGGKPPLRGMRRGAAFGFGPPAFPLQPAEAWYCRAPVLPVGGKKVKTSLLHFH
jgi:hypothetical protein